MTQTADSPTMSFPSPRLERERDLPTQYTEPLPDWVRDELNAHRDKLPELRQAICKAIAKSQGVLKKTDLNTEFNYRYAGYDALIESVRDVMAAEGVTVDHVSCDIESEINITTRYGSSTVWKWRAICLVTHVSGAAMVRIIRTMTSPGNKAAGIARTAIDRTLVTTLMRIAGAKDDATEQEDRNARGTGGDQRSRERTRNNPPGRPPQGAPPGAAAAPQNAPAQGQTSGQAQHKDWSTIELGRAKEWADLIVKLLASAHQASRLVSLARIVNGATLPKVERERLTTAWRARCNALTFDADELKKEITRLGPLSWSNVAHDPETGDMHDKTDGTLL